MIGIKGIAKKPILDATANPEDVASGKVFYNNSGKVVGTSNSIFKILASYQLNIPKNAVSGDMVYGRTASVSGYSYYRLPLYQSSNGLLMYVGSPYYIRPGGGNSVWNTWGYLIRSVTISTLNIDYKSIIVDMTVDDIHVFIYYDNWYRHNDKTFLRIDDGIYSEEDAENCARGVYLDATTASQGSITFGYASSTETSDNNYYFKIYLI